MLCLKTVYAAVWSVTLKLPKDSCNCCVNVATQAEHSTRQTLTSPSAWNVPEDDERLRGDETEHTKEEENDHREKVLLFLDILFFMQMLFFSFCFLLSVFSPDLVFCQEQQGELTEDPNPDGHEPVDPVVHRLAEG